MAWPNGARTAVSFTYDDGDGSGLDTVAPQLEAHGLRGTFFLAPGMNDIVARAAEWRSMAERGHEVANHSWDHPCGEALSAYDAERFEREQTGRTEDWLDANIGTGAARTYAYPCGETMLGPEGDETSTARYRALVERRFTAARLAGIGAIEAAEVAARRFAIPAVFPDDDRAFAERYLDQARAMARGWLVLGFHVVTAGHTWGANTTPAVHAAIVETVTRSPGEFWVAPFREVFGAATASSPSV